MELSISNIAWINDDKDFVYAFLKKEGIKSIEIAPSAIIDDPYNNISQAKEIIDKTGFKVCSMQSVLFKRTESIFQDDFNMNIILQYMYKCIDFARAVNCKNLVFGSPKNRNVNNEEEYQRSLFFFSKLNDYLKDKDIYIALEANPAIYGTNFINTTAELFSYLRKLNKSNIKANLDLGTIIVNNEDLSVVKDNWDLIYHVHISEPYLKLIEKREVHKKLFKMLKANHYHKYISIEMKAQDNVSDIFNTVKYLKGIADEI